MNAFSRFTLAGTVLALMTCHSPMAGAEITPWGDDSWRWEIPNRADAFWMNWVSKGAYYQPGYASKQKVRVKLDACDTQIRGEKPNYFWWHVDDGSGATPMGEQFVSALPGAVVMARMIKPDLDGETTVPPDLTQPTPPPPPCARFVELMPGSYRVTVGIGMTSAKPDRERTRHVHVSHLKVGVVGDSMAAGEGNPDIPTEFMDCFSSFSCVGDVLGDSVDLINGLPDAFWIDRRCHRSRSSGYTINASNLDYFDDRSAVTTLSFACSGAGTKALIEGYKGQETDSGDVPQMLPAQIDALASALPPRPVVTTLDDYLACGVACTRDPTDKRPHLDALVISVGINDLGFSSLLTACAGSTSHTNSIVECDTSYAEQQLANLAAKFSGLANKINQKLHVGRVYITEYPYLALTDSYGNPGGCNFLSTISGADAVKLHDLGHRLNAAIARAAQTHHWHYVAGIAQDFNGHGYCAKDTWFVQLHTSFSSQVNPDGTLHPNSKGQNAIAARLKKAFEDTRLMVRRGIWRTSGGGTEPWYEVNYAMESENLIYGDFNGDGRQDVLLADGTAWRVSWSGRERFVRINSLIDKVSLLRVGDFNGDGVDDLFRVAGDKWYVSYSAKGQWTLVNQKVASLADLRFGKFGGPGDTTTDVFYADGATWKVSDGAGSAWRQIGASALKASALQFADVNGDGRTDILRLSGTTVLAKFTGSTVWNTLVTLPVHLSKVRFGDFDGNKKADAFWISNGKWYVSYNVKSAPTLLHGYVQPVTSFTLGDFNGDGKTDVFTSERPKL